MNTWRSVRLLLTFVLPLAHFAAGWYFARNFADFEVSQSWYWQFYVFLSLSLIWQLLTLPRWKRQTLPIVLLISTTVTHVLIGYTFGRDLTVEYLLAGGFAVTANTVLRDTPRRLVAFGYPIVIAANQFPIRAWGTVLPAPEPFDIALLFGFGCFLALLGDQIQWQDSALRDAMQENHRLDTTVNLLSTANIDFQHYATEVQRRSTEEERKRIAREIHDTVGYTLMNLQMMMEAAMDTANGCRDNQAKLHEILTQSRDQAHQGLLETRRAMRSLRSLSNPLPKGKRRIEELVRVFEAATGVHVELNHGNAPATFGEEIDSVVSRVVQESLTNSFRHGQADRVTISFWHAKGELRIAITDNGHGAPEVTPGVGLEGMRERLDRVGGSLQAGNVAYGFQVLVEIPLTEEVVHGDDQDAAR